MLKRIIGRPKLLQVALNHEIHECFLPQSFSGRYTVIVVNKQTVHEHMLGAHM